MYIKYTIRTCLGVFSGAQMISSNHSSIYYVSKTSCIANCFRFVLTRKAVGSQKMELHCVSGLSAELKGIPKKDAIWPVNSAIFLSLYGRCLFPKMQCKSM